MLCRLFLTRADDYAAPLQGDLLSSSALALKTDEIEPLQLNIYGRNSRTFDIISEVGCNVKVVPPNIVLAHVSD